MFWHKVQHHFLFFFLSFILLTQSLVFVASQAVSFKNYELQADWLSPHTGQSLINDQSLFLRVKIPEQDKNISSLYFVISDSGQNFNINFEAQKGEDDIYTSLALWELADWPTGVYNINLRANILDEQGVIVDSQESEPIWIKIVSWEEYESLSKLGSGDDQIELVVSANDISELDEENLALETLSQDAKNSELANHEEILATSTTTSTATSTVANGPDLAIDTPENHSTISSKLFLVDLTTNFLSENVTVEFINTDNAAISTRDIVIEKTDGYRWVKNIELDNTFINGSYKLIVSAAIPGGNLAVNKTFDYQLLAPSTIRAEDLIMDLVNLPSNVQGQVGLRVDANLNIDNIDFVIEDIVNNVEALRIKGNNQSAPNGVGVSFFAVWDTAVLANGNYLVYVESKIDQQKVGSVKQLVTVYNLNNVVPEEALANENFEEAEPTGPSTVTTSTSTVSVANSLEPDSAGSIDCQRSGITDVVLCQKYQAGLNDSIPEICQENNILSSLECEKYIFEKEIGICAQEKINDESACREYLYQMYSSGLVCNIKATSTCQQLVSEKYVARLAYQLEQKNQFLKMIDDLAGEQLTLTTLRDHLLVARLSAIDLPLIASDKKIKVLKIKNQNNLDSTENLYFSAPALIMGDADGDGLPDDLELYYGTDPYNIDSDGDGHLDAEEIFQGYDPLSTAKLQKPRTALDQLLSAGLTIEEPRLSALAVDDNWSVSSAQATSSGLKLSGQATANTLVNIFIYSSLPFLISTQTDASGQWSYSLSDPLTEGVHQVYVSSHDQSGRLLARSAPLTFLVANITDDLPPVGIGQEIQVIGETALAKNWTWYYIIALSLFLIILLLVVFGWLKRRHRQSDGIVSQARETVVTNNTSSPTKITLQNEEASINLPDSTAVASPESVNNNQENRPLV